MRRHRPGAAAPGADHPQPGGGPVPVVAAPARPGGRGAGRARLRGRRAPHRAAPGDAERLAREAEADFDIIVAAGGDGTLNAVANGMAAAPRPLALLPLGTANVLAREIGLPRRPERLAELIAAGPARPIWPGRVGDRLFLTMASSGFDAEGRGGGQSAAETSVGRLAFA